MNAELAANEKLFNLKRDEADLSRAVLMDPAAVFREQAAALQDAASAARSAGIAIDQMQLAAANKQAWQSYLDSVDKTTLAVGSASDGVRVFFSQMGRSTESAAQQVHDVLGGAFASLNDTLLKLVEGQKMSFASFFRGISETRIALIAFLVCR